ncbi:hypothetical protein CBS101457_005916 [Exobasidium rhododendri]|nr:hypothetical protein CBS101457_005916 [Exobasidium rhododendri]
MSRMVVLSSANWRSINVRELEATEQDAPGRSLASRIRLDTDQEALPLWPEERRLTEVDRNDTVPRSNAGQRTAAPSIICKDQGNERKDKSPTKEVHSDADEKSRSAARKVEVQAVTEKSSFPLKTPPEESIHSHKNEKAGMLVDKRRGNSEDIELGEICSSSFSPASEQGLVRSTSPLVGGGRDVNTKKRSVDLEKYSKMVDFYENSRLHYEEKVAKLKAKKAKRDRDEVKREYAELLAAYGEVDSDDQEKDESGRAEEKARQVSFTKLPPVVNTTALQQSQVKSRDPRVRAPEVTLPSPQAFYPTSNDFARTVRECQESSPRRSSAQMQEKKRTEIDAWQAPCTESLPLQSQYQSQSQMQDSQPSGKGSSQSSPPTPHAKTLPIPFFNQL